MCLKECAKVLPLNFMTQRLGFGTPTENTKSNVPDQERRQQKLNDMDKYYNYAVEQMDRAAREKKKYNGYKDKPNRICFYTGVPCADRHEVYGGTANRQISFYNGFQVDLSAKKHAELHSNTTAWAQDENQKWRETYQRAYMDKQMAEWGMGEDDALQAWMLLIGKNYLEECEPK